MNESRTDGTPHDAAAQHRLAYADAYAPLPAYAQPATGVSDPGETDLQRGEQPIATGTLFIMIIFLMMIGALWATVYLMLLNR